MRLACFALLGGLTLAGPALAADIRIEHPWIPLPPPGAMTAAGYVTLTNTGKTADQLIGASTPSARSASLHQSVRSGTMMRMVPVKALPLAPRAKTAIAPGGYHLMLTGLIGPLKIGQTVPVTLQFARAGAVKTVFKVEAPVVAGSHDMKGMAGMAGRP
jgi:copper(I)-binding protein